MSTRTAPAAPGRLLARARLEVEAGVEPSTAALPARARRAIALAASVGAPIGGVLQAAAEAVEDDEQRRRDLLVATAQARLVAGGLVALPLLLVPALDVLLGLPLLAFYATPAGRTVLWVGLGMVATGGLVARRLVRGVDRGSADGPDDEVADLLAAALAAGLPASAALRAVGRVRPHRALALRRGALAVEHGHRPPADPRVGEAVALAREAEALGVGAAAALRDLARSQRAEQRARLRARAEQLPGRLTVPSVLLLLPATVLLVGAPVAAAGLALGA